MYLLRTCAKALGESPVFCEHWTQRERQIVLHGLQLAIGFRIFPIWLCRFLFVELHKWISDLADRYFFAYLQSPAPKRLQRRAVSRRFADFDRHYFGLKNIRQDLTPKSGFCAAAGGANLVWLETQFPQAPQTIIHPQRHAFHRRARKMGSGKCPRGCAE